MPGAHAAVFIDAEGECVDFGGRGTEFEIKVAAAHLRVLLEQSDGVGLGQVKQLMISAKGKSFLIRTLSDGYALVVIAHRYGAVFHVSERAMQECAYDLSQEAGFGGKRRRKPWYSVEVEPKRPRRARPERARTEGTDWIPVQVLGVLQGMDNEELGYRVRLGSGAELSLVRERTGLWWADEPLVGCF